MSLFSKRWFFCIPICFVLGYALFIAIFSVGGFPKSLDGGHSMPYLADKPIGEDGYYALTVAWNIASGKGVSYCYGKTTTGIQPLFVLLVSGIGYVVRIFGGDRWIFSRFVIFFGALNLIGVAHLLGKIAKKCAFDTTTKENAYLATFLLSLLSFQSFRLFTYGLETGVYLLLIALCVLKTLDLGDKRTTSFFDAFLLGVLFGVTELARIDFGLLSGLLILFLRRAQLISWSQLLLVIVVSGIMQLPWFLWVHHVSGLWMPSSGGASSALISWHTSGSRILEMLKALTSHFAPWMYTGGKGFLSLLSLVSFIAFMSLLYRKNAQRAWTGLKKRIIICWLRAICIFVMVYPIFFWTSFFYHRYSAIVLLFSLPLLGFTAATTDDRQRAFLNRFAPPFLASCFAVWAGLSLHTGRIGNVQCVSAGFVGREFPSSVKIGAWQSGVMGYFNDNVVNLDGKLDFRALMAARQKMLYKYIDEEDIKILIDAPGYIHNALDDNYLRKWTMTETQPLNGSVCLRRQNSEMVKR